jgi:hypothetical protein
MRLDNCHNFHDFRALAWRKLAAPIFNYIDGAADDEATLRQNAASFERCDKVRGEKVHEHSELAGVSFSSETTIPLPNSSCPEQQNERQRDNPWAG